MEKGKKSPRYSEESLGASKNIWNASCSTGSCSAKALQHWMFRDPVYTCTVVVSGVYLPHSPWLSYMLGACTGPVHSSANMCFLKSIYFTVSLFLVANGCHDYPSPSGHDL